MRYVYQEVSTKKILKKECCKCGKKFQRSITHSNTINPFNRNPDGSIRTPLEVEQKVLKEHDILCKKFMESLQFCKACG